MPNAMESERAAPSRHSWKFFCAGGFDQVNLQSGQDLANLDQLDQKLWVALSCPTRGLEFDTRTLDLIDTDKDGRIRAPELLAAVRWICGLLKQPDDLLKSSSTLSLSAISDATPEGQQLLASAKQILASLGKPEATAISVADTADPTRIFAQTQFNGDGIVPPSAASNPLVTSVINEIMACLGPETDRSGKPGINQAKTDQFFAEAQAFSDWWAKAEGHAAQVLGLGEATAPAAAALNAVRAKVDDYFTRCRLAAFDARALGALNRPETEYLAATTQDLSVNAAELGGFPLARIEAGKPLPLKEGINPAWADKLAAFQAAVVKPLLGDLAALTESDWTSLKSRLAAYEGWLAEKAGHPVEKLGLKRVREILGGNHRQTITELIAKDKALEAEANAIAAVDKLVRYHRDLYQLLNNFVSFRDFYWRKEKAVFQAGTLFLDQRSCDLCVRVEDMGKHGTMAHLSRTYLAYCECARKSTGEKMTVAVAFTDGDSDHLMVGRNGIFYDRQGCDWDATIVKIVENPISIRQAFWAPYKRLIRWIEDQVAKQAAAADAAAADKLAATTALGAKTVTTGKAPEQKPKIDVGVVAALGVAVGGITAALGALLQAFFGLGIWMPLGVGAIVMMISGPSMVIAWLKLRQRNLGPILDANGWAVNAKARINIPFGSSLTAIAALPPGAQRDLFDPYAEGHATRNRLLVLLILVAALYGLWYFGVVEHLAPNVMPKSPYLERLEKAKIKAELPKPIPATNAPPSK